MTEGWHFLVNKYWEVIFLREYIFVVIPVCQVLLPVLAAATIAVSSTFQSVFFWRIKLFALLKVLGKKTIEEDWIEQLDIQYRNNFYAWAPAGIYLLKVNNRNTRTRCEICSKSTIKTPERQWRRSGVFTVNFEHISQLVLVFLLLTLNM